MNVNREDLKPFLNNIVWGEGTIEEISLPKKEYLPTARVLLKKVVIESKIYVSHIWGELLNTGVSFNIHDRIKFEGRVYFYTKRVRNRKIESYGIRDIYILENLGANTRILIRL